MPRSVSPASASLDRASLDRASLDRASLDRAGCLVLLATRSVGRLVFTRRALPDVLPVSYVLDGQQVLIRLAAGSPIAAASPDSVVALEADNLDLPAGRQWSVIIVGRVRVLDLPDQRRRGIALGLGPPADDGQDYFLSIAAEKITGRRLIVAPDGTQVREVA